MGYQRIDERSRLMSGGGMDHQSRRLVDDDQMGIFIDHIEADRFGLRCRIDEGGNGCRDFGAEFDPMTRLDYGLAVHPHMALGDETLKTRAADIIEASTQNAIEALTGFGCRDFDGELVRGFHMKKSSDAVMASGLAPDAEKEQDPTGVRVLKYVVIFLGVLLIGCLITVFAIIGYRLANPKAAEEQSKPNELDFAIGANVQLGQVAMDGDRMALHLKGLLNDELLVIDARRGRLISRIKLNRAAQSGRAKW
jgi:hypothetical protein